MIYVVQQWHCFVATLFCVSLAYYVKVKCSSITHLSVQNENISIVFACKKDSKSSDESVVVLN